jgi:hypothetical protein
MVNRNSYSIVTAASLKTYFPSMALYVAKIGYFLCDISGFVGFFLSKGYKSQNFNIQVNGPLSSAALTAEPTSLGVFSIVQPALIVKQYLCTALLALDLNVCFLEVAH